MKITKMYNQHRRDFWFDSKCEHCGHVVTNQSGYDDLNFHRTVLPERPCPECGKSSDEVGERPHPRYPEHMSV